MVFAARLRPKPPTGAHKRRPYTVIVSSVAGEGIGVPKKTASPRARKREPAINCPSIGKTPACPRGRGGRDKRLAGDGGLVDGGGDGRLGRRGAERVDTGPYLAQRVCDALFEAEQDFPGVVVSALAPLIGFHLRG